MERMVLGRKRLSSLWLASVWILSLCAGVLAQSGTSSVHGTVLDPQGRVVTGAVVSLTNAERNFLRTQKSNASGSYLFTAVPPGVYRVQAEATGFKKLSIEEVRALVDTPSIVDLQLEIGEFSQSITVTASGAEALANMQDATIGHNFGGKQITQLPLESRNVVELLSLQPGVTPAGYVNGSRADQANVTLDGVDVNEQQTGLDIIEGLAFDRNVAFASVLRATPDSLQEFRVTVSNPNATQGRSSGGQVSLITKSGTNVVHGSFYEFHRNTVTTANDFFNNRSVDPETGEGIPRPALIRNVFGGSVGGPIKKDRAFFFYTFEGRRDASQSTVVRPVPLASLGRGEVRFLNTGGGITTLTPADINNLFPSVGVNPVGLSYLAEAARKYPANDDTDGDGLNTSGFRFNAPTPLNFNTHVARADFNLTQDGRHLLSLRGNYQSDVVTGVSQFPDTPASRLWSHPIGFAAGHTWSISSNRVNTFRYGLTRAAFSNQGDSSENNIDFRFVYNPRRNDPALIYTLDRTTPVHNLVDDFSWIRGNHNFQFGTNIRLIRNQRTTFSTSFDLASTNPSLYQNSGAVLSDPISGIDPSFVTPVNNAVSAVIGRLSDYRAYFNFDRDGDLLPSGIGIGREFATEEYDWYVQDVWKLRPNLTLTLGLRYGLSRPVYETQGFQVKPTTSLGAYFERRKAGAENGQPLNDPITVDLTGPANDRPGFYEWDKNNFQPRVALAWSPGFDSGILRKLFGSQGTSVFRGGFGITNDYYGQQLAVQFDLNNALGFASNTSIAANTYNVSDKPAPLFTHFGQDVRSLQGITTPGKLIFPLTVPSDEDQRIESSLDDTLRTPIHYSWSLSFERQLPVGLHFEASYVGRAARKLLLSRDIMALNNLVDPRSRTDWYTAAGMLADLRARNIDVTAVPSIPYFENLFPGLGDSLLGNPSLTSTQAMYSVVAREQVGGSNITDWTLIQAFIDDLSSAGPNAFFNPQYAALATFSSVGNSDYHGGSFSLRRRQTNLSFALNYTFAKSMDDASGLQNSGAYGTAFILNPLKQEDGRSVSDFDIRHNLNVNAVWELPFGRGKRFLGSSSSLVDAILGGWQLSSISRWHSGLPIESFFFDTTGWATNWQVRSKPVRARPLESSPTRGGERPPNLFSDPVSAYQSFRNPRAGEGGDRNVFRIPSFISLDFGLGKSFKMPWSETHQLQFRWEVFNATNTQRMGLLTNSIDALGVGIDPDLNQPAPAFGNFNSIQGQPRVMQFGLRYTF
jgi:hypothetical protein